MSLVVKNLYSLTLAAIRPSVLRVTKLRPQTRLAGPFNYRANSTTTGSTSEALAHKQSVKVTFVRIGGERIEAVGKEGDTLLDVVTNNDIDFDGFGACEGTLTCSTCHLIFSKEVYDSLPEKPTDDELDMLDLAYDLTETSRLGCQITLTKEMDGLEVRVPTTINDARS